MREEADGIYEGWGTVLAYRLQISRGSKKAT